ncbi:DDE-type integrase/transposase/recombinase [Methylobacterium iners]|uniref:Integrase n=1 Tax=Methylobacterium iners TaxID=418707 RepID=A0ABQ4S5I9_9HYPH|nr:DDE-type integrase/transposase/recombinase [Methylobacterium iners]GJD97753.1 hypothetical protein OCOJLMKI_4986 [Methylobacterium iners]
MKEWLTAQEIAAECLPLLPSTKRGINDLAEREGWNRDVFRARERRGRGGGMEFNIGLLPSVAQVAYRQRHIPVGPLPEPSKLQSETALSGRAALERDARLAILRAYEAFERGQRLNRQGCEALFVSKYQAGTLRVEPWIRDLVPAFSRRTLARWRAAAEEDRNSLGVDRGAARKGTGTLETANGGAVRAWMLGLVAHQPHLSADQVRTLCRAEFGDTIEVVRGGGVIEAVAMPPLRTFQQALKGLKSTHQVVLTQLTDPDRFRSTMKLAGRGTLRHVTEPNVFWQIDASPIDALCTDGRHSIYVCIDIASRRVVTYVTKTPRAAAVGLLLRRAILAWGVPGEIKIDNGSDFKARATQRLLASLGIEVAFSDAFSPEQKGFIERVINTFQHDAVTLVPGFIGHSVSDRKAIESRRSFAQRLGEDDAKTFAVQCTAAEMQAHFDAWAELRYQHREHDSLGKRTPFAVAADAAHTIRRVDERALDLLLAPMAAGDGTRIVTKLGVRVGNAHFLCGSILPGTRVFVRHDPQDLGRVFLFGTEDGDFLGEASNPDLSGIAPDVMVRAQRALQTERLASEKVAIEAVRRELRKGRSLIDRAREVWLRDQPNVVAMPRPEVEHSTPDIAAALQAATGRDQAPVAQLSGRAAETHARLLAEAVAPPAENVRRIRTHETPHLRFRRALDLEGRIAAGEAPDTNDVIWLGGYQTGPEYRALRKFHEQFGSDMSL